MKICDIKKLIDSFDLSDLEFMLLGAKMNMEVAEVGLRSSVGIDIANCFNKKIFLELGLYGTILTKIASAAETRMSGGRHAVMSSAGSGNHGITAIIPVVMVADSINASDLVKAKALALSHAINIYIKQYTGRLSSICGCTIAAATGAAAAITWLLGGNDEQIDGSIINMAANLTGMICDGGKIGCALKLASAAGAALMSAQLAIDNIVVHESNGIVASSAEETIQNIGLIANQGMVQANKVILDIMTAKQN
jgi:L-cysteine desulfidase